MSDTDRCAAFRDLACCFLCISKMREAPWLNGVCKVTINEREKQWQKARGFLCIRFLGEILAQQRVSWKRTHTHLHTHAPQRCLFTITTPLTRGNNAECVKVLHSERRTKPIFVSQLALPPDWAAPLWETSHRKTQPSPHTTGHINVQMYARNFQKSQNYWAKWGSCTQIVGIMNNYCTFSGTFLIFFFLFDRNNDFSGLIEENPNAVWSCCVFVARCRSYQQTVLYAESVGRKE